MPHKSEATMAPRKRSPSNPSEPSSHEEASFIFFTKLPMEIRILIWQYALPGPRIVHVKMGLLASTNFGLRRVRSDKPVPGTSRATWPGKEDFDDAVEDDIGWDSDDDLDPFEVRGHWRKRLCGFRTRCSTPAMLLACRESHEIASKVYVRAFGTAAAFPSIWFDFTQDILYLRHETIVDSGGWMPDIMIDECSKLDLARVQNLAVCCGDMQAMDTELWLIPTFAHFGNLKRFTAVLRHYEPPLHPELKQQCEPPKEEEASLVFADLVAHEKPRATYLSGQRYQIQVPELHEILPPLYKFIFDVQQLKRYREKWIKTGFNKWELPEIDQKVVTTLSQKRRQDLRLATLRGSTQVRKTLFESGMS